MVEVFKTNIQQQKQAEILVGMLSNYFPLSRINFDLEDCDKVLRVEGKIVLPEKIMEILHSEGFYCTILE
jgi:hypothetical protein